MKTLCYLILISFFCLNVRSADTDLLSLVKTPTTPDGLIQLPLRVHIITDIELVQKGVTMKMWVTPDDIKKTLLPEINRIWKVANIQWVLESAQERPAAKLANAESMKAYIVKSHRSGNFPDRVPNVLKLSGIARKHPVIHNLYLFPYIGQTNQGVASLSGNWAVSAVWTDKPFRAEKPPIRFQLKEAEPFKIGSISRTCSHELGHNLGLRHPDKSTQTRFDRLMGGKKHGYKLVKEEIKSARETALKRAQRIREWAQKNR